MGYLHTLYYLQMKKVAEDALKKKEDERLKEKQSRLNRAAGPKIMNARDAYQARQEEHARKQFARYQK